MSGHRRPAAASDDGAMTPELLALIAERFGALAEPGRLALLDALREGELTVGELTARTGLGQANASRHLQQLHAMGFLRRRKAGVFVHYALRDRSVLQLCDLMCGQIESAAASTQRLLPRTSDHRRRARPPKLEERA